MDQEKIEKLKLKRTLLRTAIDKIMQSMEDELANENLNDEELGMYLEQLTFIYELLKGLDDPMEEMISVEDFAEEFELVQEYGDKVFILTYRTKKRMKALSIKDASSTSEIKRSFGASSKEYSIELPKLEISKFDRSIENWDQFWSQYESIINLHSTLTKTSKFSYLKMILEDSSSKDLEGFVPTDEDEISRTKNGDEISTVQLAVEDNERDKRSEYDIQEDSLVEEREESLLEEEREESNYDSSDSERKKTCVQPALSSISNTTEDSAKKYGILASTDSGSRQSPKVERDLLREILLNPDTDEQSDKDAGKSDSKSVSEDVLGFEPEEINLSELENELTDSYIDGEANQDGTHKDESKLEVEDPKGTEPVNLSYTESGLENEKDFLPTDGKVDVWAIEDSKSAPEEDSQEDLKERSHSKPKVELEFEEKSKEESFEEEDSNKTFDPGIKRSFEFSFS